MTFSQIFPGLWPTRISTLKMFVLRISKKKKKEKKAKKKKNSLDIECTLNIKILRYLPTNHKLVSNQPQILPSNDMTCVLLFAQWNCLNLGMLVEFFFFSLTSGHYTPPDTDVSNPWQSKIHIL